MRRPSPPLLHKSTNEELACCSFLFWCLAIPDRRRSFLLPLAQPNRHTWWHCLFAATRDGPYSPISGQRTAWHDHQHRSGFLKVTEALFFIWVNHNSINTWSPTPIRLYRVDKAVCVQNLRWTIYRFPRWNCQKNLRKKKKKLSEFFFRGAVLAT